MARIPDEEIERLKQEVSLERLVEARGIELKRHGADLLGLVPLPRRPRAVAGRQPEEESLALPRGVPGRRLGDRLGHEGAGRQLPPCRRTAARRSSFSRRRRPPVRTSTVRKLPPPIDRDADDAEAAVAGGELLTTRR